MRIVQPIWILVLLILVTVAAEARSQEVGLTAVEFPERQRVALDFARRPPAPHATISAEVTFQNKQSKITVSFKKMRPAVLYAGEVTSYVL